MFRHLVILRINIQIATDECGCTDQLYFINMDSSDENVDIFITQNSFNGNISYDTDTAVDAALFLEELKESDCAVLEDKENDSYMDNLSDISNDNLLEATQVIESVTILNAAPNTDNNSRFKIAITDEEASNLAGKK